jgi:hypothetical protein
MTSCGSSASTAAAWMRSTTQTMSTRTTIRAASSVGGILCARPSSARRRSGRERNAWRDCACCRNCRRSGAMRRSSATCYSTVPLLRRPTSGPRKLKISKVKRSMTTCSRTSCCFSGDRPRSRRLPSSRSSSAGRRAAARNARTISSKSSGASHARASPSLDLTPPVPAQRPAVGEGSGIHVRALGARP